MALLVHACCAECLLGPLDGLRERGLVAYFYNPNIHPLIEFRRRLKAFRLLADCEGIETVCDEQYGLDAFLDTVDRRAARRCEQCYRMRLLRTAELARRRGDEAFTTTLLVSRHQQHDVVRRVGEEVADAVGVPFAYFDWRHLAEPAHEEARRRNLYRQQYCGCIFSEYQRYKDTGLHVYRGQGHDSDQCPDVRPG
ncbi:MAG: epoxyqueuosine reductase QueH [Phycisphaerae bacterium]|nr:epoxyqueuosine reductase QueH [Phycisphaerae bacterium]